MKLLGFTKFLILRICAVALDDLLALFHFTIKLIRFLCRKALFPTAWKICYYNRNLPSCKRTYHL